MNLSEWTLYGNTLANWTIALGVALATLLALDVVRRVAARRIAAFSRRTETRADNIIAAVLAKTKRWFLALLAVRVGALMLVLPGDVAGMIGTITVLGLLLQLAIWGITAIRAWLDVYTERNLAEDAASVTTMRAVVFFGQLIIWSVVLLVALDNLGIDITALIAGLGVGGIAVALALQNILGDLFSSLSIVIDKPFVAGDFIVVGSEAGTVERIGLKTTRVRSLSGEQLVFANSDLLTSRIRNFKRMEERRIVFSLGVVYQTPHAQMEAIPVMVREIIDAQEMARFDRAHFNGFGDFSLNFEIVYYMLSPDYNLYMDVQQAINLEIYKRFEQEEIEFAYPTQTLFIAREQGANGNGGEDQRIQAPELSEARE